MNISPTTLNRQLARFVQDKIAAELFFTCGRSGFWRAVGVGLIGFGLGAGVGLGCYGYSFITRETNNLDLLSAAFVKALSQVQLRGAADGVVHLEPNEITLAPEQSVKIDSGSRLRLDPEAKVLADGELKVQAPTVSLPQSVTPKNVGRTPTITNFTIFKSVPFEKGNILTGWMFLTSAQKLPTTQYCYYNESGDDSDFSIRINIGTDEKMDVPKTPIKAFAIATAFSKCVWFKKDNP